MNLINDQIISRALRDTKPYDSYFSKCNPFSLIFIFLTPKEGDLHCSLQIIKCTKQTHTYTYYKSIQHHYTTNTRSRNHGEIPILEYIRYNNYNHKLFNLIQNTPHEFLPSSEEQKIIKALNCFRHYCKLNISPAYLLSFQQHQTSFTTLSHMDLLLKIK